jgi:hypothetical protein
MVKDPKFATGVGLVLYGYDRRFKKDGPGLDESNLFDSMMEKMKGWFSDLFGG